MKNRITSILKSLIVPVLLLVLWWISSRMGIWSSYVLPPPEKVLKVFVSMVKSGELIRHIGASLGRVVIGFAIAFVLAFFLGVLSGLSPKKAAYYNSITEFMRHVPPLALISLLILWFGIGETSKIIIVVLASFFPMYMNIRKGIAYCDKKLLEVGEMFSFTKRQQFLRIMLPSALPDILVGLRIGLGYAWRAIIGAEMIAAASGLGYLILDAQQMSRSDKIIVGIFVIGLVGMVCDVLVGACMNRFIHYGGETGNDT